MVSRAYPWIGEAAPLPPQAFSEAAREIGCEQAAIRAIWDVEAAGKGYRRDGTLQRRFEPHHMPGSPMTWRDSLKMSERKREAAFEAAYRRDQTAALEAASWGGPQIMGFNHKDAGFRSAHTMVQAMADRESEHLRAFISLVKSWGIDSAIRAHDWQTFAVRYNGTGQPDTYARKVEAAYRKHSGGAASPTVLRMGAQGTAVKELQRALGIVEDGVFGAGTDAAVRRFQEAAKLPVDGVVGKRTWSALEKRRDASPKVQRTRSDDIMDKVIDLALKGGGGAGAGVILEKAIDRAPDGALTMLAYGGVGLVLILGAVFVARYARGTD